MTRNQLNLGGVPEHFNLPWHLAIESPACAELDLHWEDQYGGTGEMLAKLAAGELDMVSILTEGTVSAIAKGAALTILQVYVSSPLRWGIFVPAGSPYQEVSELDGARIAISRFNSGSHLMAFILARAHGWTLTDDRFVLVGDLQGAIDSFAAGESELFLWDQYMTTPHVEAGRFRQIDTLETPWPSFVIAARNEVLTGRTTEVGRVVDAVVAQATALHDRPAIDQELARRYGLRSETVRSWLDTTIFAPREAMDPSIAQKVLDTLAEAGFN